MKPGQANFPTLIYLTKTPIYVLYRALKMLLPESKIQSVSML